MGLGATLSGGIFPVLCHEAATKWESETGHTVGLVYFANILGATLGPLLTGFWLLEVWPVEVVTLVLSGAFLITGLLLGWREQGFHWLRQMWTVHQEAVVGVALAFLVAPWFYPLALERLQHRRWNVEPFAAKVQNRAGIITIVKDRQGDIVYGDGAYDGRINLDPVLNSNMIDRAFHIASLHPNPERMSEIGLSTGAWARVMTMYEPVHEFISVEINPGYLEIIGRRPEVAPVLSHPKVKLVIDDGRRWLKGHPQERFDFILMNTTFHWRSNVTNLLSKEFLGMAKQHLEPGGVIYFNATDSPDVVKTAAHVFAHVSMFRNFVAASDRPFDLPQEQRMRNLNHFVTDQGQPLFESSEELRKKRHELSTDPLKELNVPGTLKGDVITDDNMLTEFKR